MLEKCASRKEQGNIYNTIALSFEVLDISESLMGCDLHETATFLSFESLLMQASQRAAEDTTY